MNHPSELKLEQHLLDSGRSPVAGHVGGCEKCQARLSEMRQQGDDFRRFVYPATLDAVSAPRRSPFRGLWLALPAVGLAGVLLIVRSGPSSDYIGAKGGPLTLTAYAASSSAAPVAEGQSVPAATALRFRVRTGRACALTLLSVDGGGEVSKLYSREVQGDVTLPGGVKLDGKPGPERFFAVCSPDAQAVERAARQIGVRVRETRELPGRFGPQASLLIEKSP